MANLCYLANILINIDDIQKIYPCHLAYTLINTNRISKMNFCHLASALTNTDNKTNNFIKKEVGCV